MRDPLLFENAELQFTDPSKEFEISNKNQIGTGGFGKVFKVQRRKDGIDVAMKFCTPKEESEKNMLINEIGLMNQCQGDDSVVQIYGSFDYRDRIWIFLELMDDDLTSIIMQYHLIYSENVVKFILLKILTGLEHMHSLNVIHRDIKSDNVLVNRRGQIKLADFGYSCRLASNEDKRKSQVGTVAWMAPELVRGKKHGYNTSIDIWSYGILAVELAQGDPPNIEKG